MDRVRCLKSLRQCLVVAAFTLAFAFTVHATTYYVSPSGKDANPGTSARPLRTFGHSISKLASGDHLVLLEGTFSETMDLGPLGKPAAAITIKALKPASTVIQTTYEGTGIGATVPIGNIVLDGLAVTGTGWGIAFQQADKVTIKNCEISYGYQGMNIANGSDVTVQGCNVHNNKFGYLFGYQGSAGIAGLTVQHCRAADNAYEGLTGNTDGFFVESNCTSVSLQDCVAYGHADSGFDIKAAAVRLERCQAYQNGIYGFKLWRDNVLLANCVTYDNGTYGVIAAGNGVRIWNCTLGRNHDLSLQLESPDPSTVLIRNTIFAYTPINILQSKMYNDNCNLYFGSPKLVMLWVGSNGWRTENLATARSPLGPKSVVINPRFVNPTTSDYRLQANSPAIGKGVWNPLCALDVLVHPRPANLPPDLGAYVHSASTSVVAPLVLQAAAASTPAGVVQFQLSSTGDATVEISIRNFSGREIAVLPTSAISAGSNTLLWNGRSTQGTVAPAGAYLAEVQAHTETGQTANLLVRLRK